MNAGPAEDHERQGTMANGSNHPEDATVAICPPMEIPVTQRGP